MIAESTVHSHKAPSTFADMIPSVTERIDELRPDLVIAMGEYGGRTGAGRGSRSNDWPRITSTLLDTD